MIYPIKYAELYAPKQRSRECDREQNRKFRRSSICMTEGQRRREMRMMYVEIGKFALRVGDSQIERTLLDRYEPYTRVVGYKSAGIKAAHAEMSAWYDAVRAEYLVAHREDVLMELTK